ncbi:MAG: penicillin-binding transpeptidase domain-containing protein [bacterium]
MTLASMWPAAMSLVSTQKTNYFNINEPRIAEVISDSVAARHFPDTIQIPGIDVKGDLEVEYTIDAALQLEAERLLSKHNPDYGVLVAIDPVTGRVLAMADSTRDGLNHGNLSVVNTYPAASISKIVTAVAVIDQGEADVGTVIPYNGKATTLYKKNVFEHKNNKWTRKPTLRESFAKSINTVFGRLGAVEIGGETLRDYFYRMGFNARFASDFKFDNGAIDLEVEDPWQVAESASGYTRRNTLSPLHATVLAATAVNGGNLVAPVLVSRITGPYGVPLYVHDEPAVTPAMTPETASKLSKLMQATVAKGSARKSFRRFHRGHLESVKVGGKTGSLTGFKPKGRYDWFVGFGELGDRKIAFAALCINKEKWYVKSAQLARELLEYYFQPDKQAELQG